MITAVDSLTPHQLAGLLRPAMRKDGFTGTVKPSRAPDADIELRGSGPLYDDFLPAEDKWLRKHRIPHDRNSALIETRYRRYWLRRFGLLDGLGEK